MRLEVVVAGLVTLAALAGCVAPQEAEAVEAASTAMAASTGLLGHPRSFTLPAGSSYAAIVLDVTPEDWGSIDGEPTLIIAYESEKGSDVEAMSKATFLEDDGTLELASTSLIAGGAGGGSSGWQMDPEPVRVLLLFAVNGAEEPFEVRVGASKEFPGELEGEPIPIIPHSIGQGDALSAYFEFGSPFDAVFPNAPFASGIEVSDGRLAPPGSVMATAAGALRLSFDHAPGAGGLHVLTTHASTFGNARVGALTVDSALDDEEPETFQAQYTDFVFARRVGPFAATAQAEVVYEDVAASMPITVVNAITVPLDLANLGLDVGDALEGMSATPFLLEKDGLCVDVRAPSAPTAAACHTLQNI